MFPAKSYLLNTQTTPEGGLGDSSWNERDEKLMLLCITKFNCKWVIFT